MFSIETNKFLGNSIRGLFYIFIALFPFINYMGHLYYGTTTRAENLFLLVEILAVIVGFALLNRKNKLSFSWSPIGLSLLLFLIIMFISGINGVNFLDSFWSKATRMTGLFYFLHLGLFYLLFSSFFNNSNHINNFLRVFLISTGIFSIISLFSTSFHFFGNSTFAAMYLYAAFLLSIYYVSTSEYIKNKWWRFFIPIIFIINPYLINRELWLGGLNIFKNPLDIIGEAQTSSIIMFFSIIILIGMFLISKIKRIKYRQIIIWSVVAIGLLLVSFASYSLVSSDGYLQKIYLKNASSARPIVWNLSKDAIKDRPLLGWGGDNFDRAFEDNYDNTLLENKNGPEPWFDRAHNIFIDQTIETGYTGMIIYILIYIVIIGSMLYVIFKSKEKSNQILASIIIVYTIGHFFELQTAFDTSISYIPVAIMLGLATIIFNRVYLYQNDKNKIYNIPVSARYILGSIFIGLFAYLLFVGTVPIIKAENINSQIRKVGTSEKRIPLYDGLFGSPVDKPAFIWRTSSDIQRGIAEVPVILENPQKVEGLKKEIEILIEEAEEYVGTHPDNYRMKLSLADLYIYQRLFNIDTLKEAQNVLDDAISLHPEIPQAYWMKSVAYLYMGKFSLAYEFAKKGYDLNPSIEQSQIIVDYIDRSIKTFPNIDLFYFGVK